MFKAILWVAAAFIGGAVIGGLWAAALGDEIGFWILAISLPQCFIWGWFCGTQLAKEW